MNLDTIRILYDPPTQSTLSLLLPYLAGIIGAVVGGAITYLASRQQLRAQYESQVSLVLVNRKLDAFSKLAELAYLGHNVSIHRSDARRDSAYPSAYEKALTLRDWMNNLGNHIDQQVAFLDNETRNRYKPLNQAIIDDLDTLTALQLPENEANIECRNLGRQHLEKIKTLTENLIDHITSQLESKNLNQIPTKKSI